MLTVTVPTYEELMAMFPDSDGDYILNGDLTLWEYKADEMSIPGDRVLEFAGIRSDGILHDEVYDIYIHKDFYDFLKNLESQTFGSHRSLGKPSTYVKPF